MLNSIENLIPKFKPDPLIIGQFLDSNDENIKTISLCIQALALKDNKKSIIELLNLVSENKQVEIIEKIINLIIPKGKSFIKILFIIYNFQILKINILLSNLILKINDNNTRNLLIYYIENNFFELPDNEFGISLANFISEWSINKSNITFLIPSNFSQKSENFQIFLLNCSISFWFRLKFKFPEGLKNRIKLLTNSNFLQVRQISNEFLILLENLINNDFFE